MVRRRPVLSVLAILCLNLIPLGAEGAEKDWALSLYYGRLTDEQLTTTATGDFHFENAYFVDLGASRRLYTHRDYFNVEIEGQIARHFENQDNGEFCFVAYLRWLRFPWNEHLNTSFAAGVGISYATAVPAIEAKYYDDTSQLLGALMFEFAFSLPRVPQWRSVVGIHHRSGAAGTFSGVRGASNAWVVGIRYAF
jgi:hypothetical protein